MNGVDLSIRAGESVGLVGESGSGKSVTCRALLGLLPPSAEVESQRMVFDGVDVTRNPTAHAAARGRIVSLVGQDPFAALNPHLSVAQQLEYVVRLAHPGAGTEDVRREVRSALEAVRMNPERGGAYPDELSGGMRQRISIALAVARGSRLIVADEPTSSLDVTTQEAILALLADQRRRFDRALLLVTHDLGVAREMCDRVLVMYGGLVVEEGPTGDVLERASHPYTRGLIRAVPSLDTDAVEPIRGKAEPVLASPTGCPFADRCDYVAVACRERIPDTRDIAGGGNRLVRCVSPLAGPVARIPRGEQRRAVERSGLATAPVLDVRELSVRYDVVRGVIGRRVVGAVDALRDVSFALHAGEVIGVVGETGAGKSTLLRAILRLDVPSSGRVILDGTDVSDWSEHEFRPLRERMQVVFQNPGGALDPTYRVREAVREPLDHFSRGDREIRRDYVARSLHECGLDVVVGDRAVRTLSGGQQQRVGIARSVVDPPRLLLADEPVSALDVSVQAGVLALLTRLVREHGFAMLFVTHDLTVVRLIADRVLVLREGRQEELTDRDAFFSLPQSEYGRELLAAARRTASREDSR